MEALWRSDSWVSGKNWGFQLVQIAYSRTEINPFLGQGKMLSFHNRWCWLASANNHIEDPVLWISWHLPADPELHQVVEVGKHLLLSSYSALCSWHTDEVRQFTFSQTQQEPSRVYYSPLWFLEWPFLQFAAPLLLHNERECVLVVLWSVNLRLECSAVLQL